MDEPTTHIAVASSAWLGVIMLVCWSTCLLMLLVLLYDQICVIYEWQRKYRENRSKNQQPESQTSDPLVDALLCNGVFGRYLRKFGEQEANRKKHLLIWHSTWVFICHVFNGVNRVVNVVFGWIIHKRMTLTPNDRSSPTAGHGSGGAQTKGTK